MTSKAKLAGGLAAVALVLVSASPADARGYGRWHRHHDRVDAGAVFGVLLGVGVLAAVASAASRDRDPRDRRYDERRYDPRYDDRRYDDRRYDDPRSDSRGYDGRAADDRAYGGGANYADEDNAVDACAAAARDDAGRSGDFAEIRDITGARPYGNGWDVTGTVDQRSSYRASDSRLRSFRCIWEDGRVSGVTFGG